MTRRMSRWTKRSNRWKNVDRACTRIRGRWEGSALLWQSIRFVTGRCVKIHLRFTDHEGGTWMRDTLEEAFRHYGFMVSRTGRKAVDRELYRRAERWL